MKREDRDVVERALISLRRAGAVDADCTLLVSEGIEVRVRAEEIEHITQSREKVLGLRAFVGGEAGLQQATTSTSDLGDEAVDHLVEQTLALANATVGDPHAGLPDEAATQAPPDLGLFDPADWPAKIEDRIADARRAETAARESDERIVNSEGSEAWSRLNTVVYGNTRGFLSGYASATHGISSTPLAGQGKEKQRDYWYALSRTLSGLPDPGSVGRTAADRAVSRLGAASIATCEAPVVFEPRVAASLLRHLLSSVSGYAIYRGASFLIGKLGEQIASPGVSVIDDGTLPRGLGSKPFDAEGLPTRRNVIVRDGRLETYLYDCYSARKLGASSTGSAAGSAGTAPVVEATNLWLEPGPSSMDEIIASTQRGLLVTELIGMGFNVVTGDYSRGAAGIWIENGTLTRPVEEVTIAGHLGDMLRGMDAIGSDLLWLGPTASPSLRISRMTIAGR